MSKKTKWYHVYGRTTASDGKERVVTIVGEFVQTRKHTEVKEDVDVETNVGSYVKGELKFNIKVLNRKLTLGMSICHPSDTFDEEIGIEIAKKRIKLGQDLGSLETSNVTMLTEDAIIAELMVKLNHIMNNIDDFLP